MEVQMSAASFRDLLAEHKKALKQVQAIDIYITDLNKKILRACLVGNHGYGHNLTLRYSVAMGIRHMYKQYEDRKWNQLLQAARSFLEGDALDELESEPRNHGRVTTMDQAAPQWSILFSERYRHN